MRKHNPPYIGVIIVLYNDIHLNFKSIIGNEKLQLIIVDNTPNRDLNLNDINLNYIPLKKNIGLAKAQNIGIQKAKEIGCSNIIFFDQDSVIQEETIFSLAKGFTELTNSGIKIAAIGPTIINKTTHEKYKSQGNSSEKYSEVSTLISSGTYTSLKVVNEVGGMEDNLFIDLVDHEWCWRAQNKGYKLFLSNSITINHSVGNDQCSLLGFPIIISTPFRYYYIYRNTLLMFGRNYVPLNWKMKRIIRSLATLIFIPFSKRFKNQKTDSIKNASKGIFDALFHKK